MLSFTCFAPAVRIEVCRKNLAPQKNRRRGGPAGMYGRGTMPAPPPLLNDNEALVPQYELPQLLAFEDGSAVAAAADWGRRRAELLALFRTHVHGHPPEPEFRSTACSSRSELLSSEVALGGRAIRQELQLTLDGPSGASISCEAFARSLLDCPRCGALSLTGLLLPARTT